MIEAYKATGAIVLAREFSLDELNLLLAQTAQFRRDPEERKREEEAEDAKEWMRQNKGRKMKFRSADGQIETIDLGQFELAD